MADSHRSALRPRGRPCGRHARLIVRCSTREFPVAMGPLRPVWAACRARWSHAISDALAVSRARIRGGRGGRLIGRCRLCSQVRRGRSSGGSARAAHDLGALHLRGHLRPSRSTSSRSRSGRSGAIPMPWSPRAMSNSCVSARLLAQARKRVSRGGVGVSTRRHRTRNRTRRSPRWENILESNVPRTVWIKWLENISPRGWQEHNAPPPHARADPPLAVPKIVKQKHNKR